MKRITLVLVAAGFLAMSCNTTQPQQENEQPKESPVAVQEASSGISLDDNGQRWEVNEEMKPFLTEGEHLVNTYQGAALEDYHELAAQLKEQNASLIKSCTMKGRAHEELHQWLHPYLDLVAALGETEQTQQAEDIVKKLKQSFDTFHHYFQ